MKNWRIVAELAEDDRGASGASFELPQLKKVLAMAEAKVIQMICDLHTKGSNLDGPMSIRAIANELTSKSAPTHGDLQPDKTWRTSRYGRWNPNSVRSILINETYAGVWKFRVRSELGALEVEVSAIIDRSIWEMSQARHEKQTARAAQQTA
ncbi:MAG TPA: recombinase family protein [Anaerolineae bacterium]|nr:recombinase family protein [Anaerolineae bacterium]